MKNRSDQISERRQKIQEMQTTKISRYFLLAVLIGMMVLVFEMIKIFLVPIVLATVFTTLFFPLYKWLLKVFKENKPLSSLLCCAILLLGLLIPVFIIVNLVSIEVINFYQSAESQIREITEKGDEQFQPFIEKIENSKWITRFHLDEALNKIEIDWQSMLKDIAKAVTGIITDVLSKTSRSTFEAIVIIFVTLFTMFYFFMDGELLIKRLMYLSPLDDDYEREIFSRFASISRATIKGTLVIGLLQGGLGGLTLWIFGVKSAVLWGFVMVILSIIPMIGSWAIMLPAGIIQIILGNIWQGILILAISGLIIGNVDNLIRPRLVGKESGMHDLMIFFSTLGGISLFGAMGFIVGPVFAALFLAILDIYSKEFKTHLDLASEKGITVGTPIPVKNQPLEEPGQSDSSNDKEE